MAPARTNQTLYADINPLADMSFDAKVTYFKQEANQRPAQGTEGIMAYVYDMPRNAAIADLPDDLRSAVTLREFDGLSYEDIADIMDCPVGTVRSRIFRAREAIDSRVREQLEGAA